MSAWEEEEREEERVGRVWVGGVGEVRLESRGLGGRSGRGTSGTGWKE